MARQVTGTTNNFLSVLTGEAIPYPFTVSCRVKATATAGVPFTYGEGFPEWDGDYSAIGTTGGQAVSGKGTTFVGTSFVPPTLATGIWHLLVCVFTSVSERRVYVNNGATTAVETSTTPAGTHTNKNLTLGGVLVTASTLHPPAGFDSELADAAIWNTALTAADVDALAAGRPGDVKPANLKAWWKLGEDGDLTSSVGTYGPMVVFGTVPVTADPPHPGQIVIGRGTLDVSPLDADAPSQEKLLLWYPSTSPSLEYWSNREGHSILNNSSNITLHHGEDSSQRRLLDYGDCYLVGFHNASPSNAGQTFMCWLRVYSFNPVNSNPYAWYGFVPVFAVSTYNMYWATGGYFTYAAAPYGWHQRLTFTDALGTYQTGGVVNASYLPIDEWFHATWVYDQVANATHFYLNGRYDGTSFMPVLGGGPVFDTPVWVHGVIAGILSWGDYAVKDFRIYRGMLNADEMGQVYQHTLDYHRETSSLVPQWELQGKVEATTPPVPPVGNFSSGHHILGAI